METTMQNWHIVCKVIDNLGDIGVTWRLARQLRHEYRILTHLWVDDLKSFHTICPAIDITQDEQEHSGVTIHLLNDVPPPLNSHDVVIETFSTGLPTAWLDTLKAVKPQPQFFNIEYLSTEPWAETCHGLPSTQPQTGIQQIFFFPGFSPKTGGLIREKKQTARIKADKQANKDIYAKQFSVNQPFRIFIFAYPNAPLQALCNAILESDVPVIIDLPYGVLPAQPTFTERHLTVQRINWVAQEDFDDLLSQYDLIFVRGEDSLVRAQWANIPAIWQPYPQEANAHWDKLRGYLTHTLPTNNTDLKKHIGDFHYAWNHFDEMGTPKKFGEIWQLHLSLHHAWQEHHHHKRQRLAQQTDLAQRLVTLARASQQVK